MSGNKTLVQFRHLTWSLSLFLREKSRIVMNSKNELNKKPFIDQEYDFARPGIAQPV
jgi:hypothetical protein